jgi:hypothetical protein
MYPLHNTVEDIADLQGDEQRVSNVTSLRERRQKAMRPHTVFHHIGLDTEWIEDYLTGGYHPVHIGDRLGPNERYVIQRKLGFGADGTVWLAHDSWLVKR